MCMRIFSFFVWTNKMLENVCLEVGQKICFYIANSIFWSKYLCLLFACLLLVQSCVETQHLLHNALVPIHLKRNELLDFHRKISKGIFSILI